MGMKDGDNNLIIEFQWRFSPVPQDFLYPPEKMTHCFMVSNRIPVL
jgi:hypothetical protein